VLTFRPPSGPGVRLDSGVEQGDIISGQFDSMLAKLIVTGADRQQALERSRRALAEFEVEGMPTALTFHRVVVDDPAFAPAGADEPFSVYTTWMETDFDNQIEPYGGPSADAAEPEPERQKVIVEVGGKRVEVSLPGDMSFGGGGGGGTIGAGRRKAPRRGGAGAKGGAKASGDSLTAPMQGTIVKLNVADGDSVNEGDLVLVLEAMKMEQPINAHKSGTISGLKAAVGETVTSGSVLCDIKGEAAAEE
jgi:acetyl-CoA/propionyl-CoA carboxylase biotin carboxyl carrier protein